MLKEYGLQFSRSIGAQFRRKVVALVVDGHQLRSVIEPLLTVHALGWTDVTVIDDDLGRSGSGISRPGFEKLLAAICEGRVGAVFAIEVSRLARNGRDWHTLIEFCGLVGTVIVDEDGIYEPRHPNDRLLLGMIYKMAGPPVFRQTQPSVHRVWLRFIAICPEYVVQDLISCLELLSLPFDQPINCPVLQPASSNVSGPDVCTPSGCANA